MKIAMITSDYLPNVGGITSHIVEISQAMAKQGHIVKVWFLDSEKREPVSLGNVSAELLELKPVDFWPRGIWYSIGLVKVIGEKMAQFEPEILHVHTLAPLSLCMRWLGASHKYRRILTNHSSGYLNMIKSQLGQLKARFYCGAFDGLLAPSCELLEKSRLLGLDNKRCQYIPNGVDEEKFAPGDKHKARSRLDLPNEKVVLLATRRFAVKNGLRYLAEALDVIRREIPNILCVFCGGAYDSEELAAVHNIVRDRGLQEFVRFEGEVPNNEVKNYLNACEVVILPSLVEATSISALEAMSAAKPIVGTHVGGIPELVVEGVTGTLVKPADAQDLANGIIHTIKESDLRALGEAARQRVLDQFTWEKVASRTINFYRTIWKLGPC